MRHLGPRGVRELAMLGPSLRRGPIIPLPLPATSHLTFPAAPIMDERPRGDAGIAVSTSQVNNAGVGGVVIDQDGVRALNIDPSKWLSGAAANLLEGVVIQTYDGAVECVNTNYYGIRRVTEGLLPLLKQSPSGARIVNTTSLRSELKRMPNEKLREELRKLGVASRDVATAESPLAESKDHAARAAKGRSRRQRIPRTQLGRTTRRLDPLRRSWRSTSDRRQPAGENHDVPGVKTFEVQLKLWWHLVRCPLPLRF
ncbi:unnamed protein product [Miscanthus lutarioriparius]|uniref:Uncharacterized protein n=1 Tax=Miscanthus lutarioriparius TaxID=422564 RepID=A0A811NBE2_9POAL|nr:unnamed protein product [Miscanthus lutarioriparius]